MQRKQYETGDLGFLSTLNAQPAEPGLCHDLTTEEFAASLTEAEVNELLSNSAALDCKWSVPQQSMLNDDAFLTNDEVSYEVGYGEPTLLSTDSNDFTTFLGLGNGNASRPSTLVDSKKFVFTPTPSVLVSPASEYSTSVATATPLPRRRRRNSSCSSDSASDTTSMESERTSAAPAAKARSGAKRRRGSSRQSAVAKGSDEYRRRRVRNNVAVRKSRDKAKQRQEETSRRVTDLSRENDNLSRQLETVTQELTLLRSIFSNLGVPIQQLVTDALRTATKTTSGK